MKHRIEKSNITNATMVREYYNQPDYQEETVKNLSLQIQQNQMQITENQKQTLLLKQASELTAKNVECTEKLIECTNKMSKASTLQFWAMFIIGIAAVIVAILK